MSKFSRRTFAPLSVSQNFLTNRRTILRLLGLTSIDNGDLVVEIGAGKGHITRELIKKSGKLITYEIDANLIGHLNRIFVGVENLEIRHMDFLKAALPRIPYKVFANIPFSRTSEIVRKLTSAQNPPDEAWLVMEKGAAKRFIGKPGENASSVSIKPFFDSEVLYYFSKQDFHPAPATEAVLVHFSRKPQYDLLPGERTEFIKFYRQCMQHGINRFLTKKQVSTALRLAALPSIEQSATMRYVQWLCLFRCYRRFHGGK